MKFLILAALALSCTAVPYGNSYSAGSYGSPSYSSGAKLSTGYSGYSGYNTGYNTGYKAAGVAASNNFRTQGVQVPNYNLLTQFTSHPHQEVVQAAVQQLGRTIEYKAVPYSDAPIQAQVIEVEPSEVPLHLHFKTRSSNIVATQSHVPGEVHEVQEASSQDEPTRLSMVINKPILQEVREVVSPFRQIQTEILPVQENVHTVVTKAEGVRAQYQAKPYQGQSYQGQTYAPKTQAYQGQTYAPKTQAYQTQSYAPKTQAYQSQSYAPQSYQAFQVAQPLQNTYQVAQSESLFPQVQTQTY